MKALNDRGLFQSGIPLIISLLCLLTGLFLRRVFCVKFSCDASYVISGSDDTNLRLWKAKASEQLGVVSSASGTGLYLNVYFCMAVPVHEQLNRRHFSLTWNHCDWPKNCHYHTQTRTRCHWWKIRFRIEAWLEEGCVNAKNRRTEVDSL